MAIPKTINAHFVTTIAAPRLLMWWLMTYWFCVNIILKDKSFSFASRGSCVLNTGLIQMPYIMNRAECRRHEKCPIIKRPNEKRPNEKRPNEKRPNEKDLMKKDLMKKVPMKKT